MTTACPYLVCLLSLMPGLISIGYTQKKHDPARAATKFSKRNKTYDIHYDGHTGKHGHNALDLFKFMDSTLFRPDVAAASYPLAHKMTAGPQYKK